jgi:uncharacterized membrane protein (UPF0127 family)
MRPLAIAILVLALGACDRTSDSALVPDHVVTFTPGGARLSVSVADTDDARVQGLKGVEALAADEGMVFLWREPVQTAFWMKDTLIPLSIAFVDEDGRIVTIREMQPCDADPCPTYGADAPFVMAVEANIGYFADVGIAPGDRATLEPGDA